MNDDLNQIALSFKNMAPNVDFWTLRLTDETREANLRASGGYAACI